MAKRVAKSVFFADLRAKIERHSQQVVTLFQPLPEEALNWHPDAREWSILQCFDHLNLTHAYYEPKVEASLALQQPVKAGADTYKPSFWGGIYMFFALNPKYTFPATAEMVPDTTVSPVVLSRYLAKQEALRDWLVQAEAVDLSKSRVPIATAVNFNLGDCLKVLVYHDALHFRQAQGVLDNYSGTQP